jgi:hypothetical protein
VRGSRFITTCSVWATFVWLGGMHGNRLFDEARPNNLEEATWTSPSLENAREKRDPQAPFSLRRSCHEAFKTVDGSLARPRLLSTGKLYCNAAW